MGVRSWWLPTDCVKIEIRPANGHTLILIDIADHLFMARGCDTGKRAMTRFPDGMAELLVRLKKESSGVS